MTLSSEGGDAVAKANIHKKPLELFTKNIIAKKIFDAILTPLLHAGIPAP